MKQLLLSLLLSSVVHYNFAMQAGGSAALHEVAHSLSPAEKALIDAAKNGNLELVRTQLASSANINAQDTNGTALMIAAYMGHNEVVEELLARGAEVNVQNSKCYTALIFAAYQGHADVVELLLTAGADVNAPNIYGRSEEHTS